MRNFRLIGLAPLILLAGCEPPQQSVMDSCHKMASVRASGKNLTPRDVGELVEACMAERGYLLHKTDESCAHDLSSQSQRRCYYSNSLWGRFHRAVTAD